MDSQHWNFIRLKLQQADSLEILYHNTLHPMLNPSIEVMLQNLVEHFPLYRLMRTDYLSDLQGLSKLLERHANRVELQANRVLDYIGVKCPTVFT